jgi:hypothetical protein
MASVRFPRRVVAGGCELMPAIPGEATEIRYRRTGALAGRYYHRFRPGVRMHANRDGSVTLRGIRKLHAVESEPGFWDKYQNPPRRRQGSGRRPASDGLLWLVLGVAVAVWSMTRVPATAVDAAAPNAPVSGSDWLRTMQADADAAAAAAPAPDPLTLLSAVQWV